MSRPVFTDGATCRCFICLYVTIANQLLTHRRDHRDQQFADFEDPAVQRRSADFQAEVPFQNHVLPMPGSVAITNYYFMDRYNLDDPYPVGFGGATVPGPSGAYDALSNGTDGDRPPRHQNSCASMVNEAHVSYTRLNNTLGVPKGGSWGGSLLGLRGFVIYPILPDRFVDRWQLLNARQAWVTVIVLASIRFLNYVLLRLYIRRGLDYTAVREGLVNSTATAAELCGLIDYDEGCLNSRAIGIILLTRIAMFV